MKILIIIFLIQFSLTFAKIYTACEFVNELFYKHDLRQEEIVMHVYIAKLSQLVTTQGISFIGIYSIGTEWWCGADSPGGICNVKCSNLKDDDITDDVACANEIITRSAMKAWRLTADDCKTSYQKIVKNCLNVNENYNANLILLTEKLLNLAKEVNVLNNKNVKKICVKLD
ncbi:hypothetical protein ACKWTF_014939 [Chironomus riparius]